MPPPFIRGFYYGKKQELSELNTLNLENLAITITESGFNEFKPRLKSIKKRFLLIAGLNLKTSNAILSGTNHI